MAVRLSSQKASDDVKSLKIYSLKLVATKTHSHRLRNESAQKQEMSEYEARTGESINYRHSLTMYAYQ